MRAIILPLIVSWLALASGACSASGSAGPCHAGALGCACGAGDVCADGASCVEAICVETSGIDAGSTIDAGARPDSGAPMDAAIPDVGPNLDAFFAEDPPPLVCLPDGGSGPDPMAPGGTPECPDDKHREGCRCDAIGERVPCWPGLRANRNRGQCQDGMTTCEAFDEFSGRWGTCEGHVLPTPGVSYGPGACRCFSEGQWLIDNLSPCFIDFGADGVWAVSTFIGPDGLAHCPTSVMAPPPPVPEPGTTWSTNRLRVDCEGEFRLCFTIKTGVATAPSPTDCVVAEVCTDAWYETRDTIQEIAALPSWVGADAACAESFQTDGGYGEMSVSGVSVECDPIDDGSGARYVFNRVGYCPSICGTPAGSGMDVCASCGMGGSGSF
ncbi:MAG: hypothetical protein OEY14_08440 [Myxococcales bacterium]|nr:hypothetical protein [Myxococcales bacterium]